MKFKLKNIKLGIILQSLSIWFLIMLIEKGIAPYVNISVNGIKNFWLLVLELFFIFTLFSGFNKSFKKVNEETITTIGKLFILFFIIYILYIFIYFPVSIFLSDSKKLILIITFSIFTGISEELEFRAFTHKLFYYNKIIYLLISSLTFGLLHLKNGFIGFIATTVIGFYFAIAKLNGVPLWFIIITHSLIDIPPLTRALYSITSRQTTTLMYLILDIALLLSISLTIWYLSKKEVWKSDFTLEKTKKKSIWYYIFEYYGDFKNDPLKNGEAVTNPGLLEK